jgi:hypothetical protein
MTVGQNSTNLKKFKLMTDKLSIWEPTPSEIIPPNVTALAEVTECAVQLTLKDKGQISRALERGDFEVGINHLWMKSMAALKRELGTLGSEFLGEMLNKPDIDEDDSAQDILTDGDAIRLAGELGIVTSTESLRLRQTHETVLHFANDDFKQGISDVGEMSQAEAARALETCIVNILGKPHIEVAQRFVDFRRDLLESPLAESSGTITLLENSPYFFRKLSINILLSAIKTSSGATLEISLGNLNVILPSLWKLIRDTEKWHIGTTYRDVYTSGNSIATKGVKSALLKVHGFDYVPETIRSDTFIKAADAIIMAHEGMNNFYNEPAPVKALVKLGKIIPAPALPKCTSALLAVYLGNPYGVCRAAAPIAKSTLDKYTQDRWKYYLDQCLPSDMRILDKIIGGEPRDRWISLVNSNKLDEISFKNSDVSKIIKASKEKNYSKITTVGNRLRSKYYGK